MRAIRFFVISLSVLLLAAWLSDGPALAKRKRRKKKKEVPPIEVMLEQQLWDVLEPGTRSGDIPARGLALDALCWLRPSQSVKYAVDALKDPQWRVRAGAVRALIRRGHPAAPQALAHEMTRGRADVGREIMPLLEKLPEKTALALLSDVLSDPGLTHRAQIADGIANGGGPVAEALFRTAIVKTSKPNAVLRDAVARLKERHLPLLKLAAQASSGEVQRRVLEASAKLPEAVDRAFLRALLKASDEDVRMGAAEQLAAAGDKSTVSMLIAQLGNADKAVALRALRALAGTPTPEARKAARTLMENTEQVPQEHFAAVLDATLAIFAAAGDTQLLSLMQRFLTGTDAVLRNTVVRHFGKVQGPRSLPTLHDLLFDGNPAVRKGAAEAIGDTAQSESIFVLKRALDDRDQNVRRETARALARIHDKAVVGVVSFLVSDRDVVVRRAATEALLGTRHMSALDGLRIALNDREPDIRLIAYRGLLTLAPSDAKREWRGILNWIEPEGLTDLTREFGANFLPYLEAALANARPEIREGAVRAAGLLGKVDRIGMLGRVVLEHSKVDVRLAALKRLVAEQGKAAYPLVRDLTRDGELAVRRAALGAMACVGERPAAADDARAFLVDGDEGIRITAAATITAVLSRQ